MDYSSCKWLVLLRVEADAYSETTPHSYGPQGSLELTTGSLGELTKYQFYRKILSHYSCPICGVHIFEFNEEEKIIGLNVRTVDGIDPLKLKLMYSDGKNEL